MDVTPSPKMFQAMQKLCDAYAGEQPSPLDHSTAANNIRNRRSYLMEFLHSFAALCMREGVNRAVKDAQAHLAGPRDMEDRNAQSQAQDDAMAGKSRVILPGI